MSAPCKRCHRHTAELDANGRCKDTYHCGRCVLSDLENRRPYQKPGTVTLHPSERDEVDVETDPVSHQTMRRVQRINNPRRWNK